MHLFFADFILFLHFILVFFITFLFFLVPIGYKIGWLWVSNFKLRVTHTFLMFVITFETILGITCPLTFFENTLRGNPDTISFVGLLVSQIIYWDIPYSYFTVIYCFCLAWTLIMWRIYPPRSSNQT